MNGILATNCYGECAGEVVVPESVYQVIELVGTSDKSWEDAARNAVDKAGENLKDIRIAEVSAFDMKIDDNKVVAFRAKVKLSYKIW